MLTSLKPVSDLQRVQHFDDYDLAANRTGVFSPRQRRHFILARLLEHLAGALVAAFLILAMWSNFQRTVVSDPRLIAIVVVLAILCFAILFMLRIRLAFSPVVKALEGQVRKDEPLPVPGLLMEQITIGAGRFYVPFPVFDVLDEGAIYRVYYVERGKAAGGKLLLSAELITPAPDEEDED